MNGIFDAGKYRDLCLYECGREQCIPDKIFTFTPKDYHLFHYVCYGKGEYNYRNMHFDLKKGDLFYIAPHEVPHYKPNRESPWIYIWVGFGGEKAEGLLSSTGISQEAPVVSDAKECSMRDLFEGLYDSYTEAGELDLTALGYAYQIFMALSKLKQAKGGEEERRITVKQTHIKEAKEFICNNFQFQISVQDIAKSLGISANYLANIFNESLGISPKQYLTRYRMDRACAALKTGSFKIADVGKMVGYRDQLHFSSEFRKMKGMSPSDYIKKYENQKKTYHFGEEI